MTKTTPTRRRSTARAAAREHGDQLREWLSSRQLRASLTRRKARKAARGAANQAPDPSRGTGRVPDRYRDSPRETHWVHQHMGHPMTPYVNPERDAKPGARLRKELQS